MTLRRAFLTLVSVAGLAMALSAPASAVTVNEVGYGQFSKLYDKPTELASDVDGIAGTGWQNQYDIVHFTGLNSGEQTITIDFFGTGNLGYSYQSGGVIKYSYDAFDYAWDGTDAGSFYVDYYTPSTTLSFDLDSTFDGDLYLALYFTGQNKVSYNLASSNPIGSGSGELAAAVPLPAGFVLLGSVLAGGGLMAAARRRKAAQA